MVLCGKEGYLHQTCLTKVSNEPKYLNRSLRELQKNLKGMRIDNKFIGGQLLQMYLCNT